MTTTQLRLSRVLWGRRVNYRKAYLAKVREAAHRGGTVTNAEADRIHKWERLLSQAERMVKRRTAQLAHRDPLRIRAHRVAAGLIGTMEQGGNNAGPMVSKIIRANGGAGPEPWCGDFVAYAYRTAGSKAVVRAWAAVRLLAGLAGIRRAHTPLRGDLVRFTFDHVGMFEKDNGDGTITTIEGNTGASGAVSDSATGGDGVYRKVRNKALVRDYLRVSR